jgi:hypothetical protein
MRPMRGTYAEQLSGESKTDVKISALYDQDLSQESYHLIRIYFLNLNDQWLRIKSIHVVEVPGIEDFHFIKDQDLATWKKSMLLDFDLKVEAAMKEKKELPPPIVKEKLQQLDLNYSLFEPLSLPGKLQVESWTLLQTPGMVELKEIIIEVTYIDSSVVKYKLLVSGVSL